MVRLHNITKNVRFIMLLQPVVENAILHGIDAEENRDGCIEISCQKESEKLVFAVKDNGCGMTSEQLTNVFHPFVTTKEHGTGLGLPIVRKIVTAPGGTVRVSSTPGKGSEFQMYLPLLPVASVYL